MKKNRLALLLASFALAGCVEKRLGPGGTAGAPRAVVAKETAPAATPTPYFPQNRPLNEQAPVKLRADKLVYDSQLKETHFMGHVVARQDTTRLEADHMRSTNQGESARAEGHLRLLDLERRVELLAAKGDYSNALATARLRGGVVLHSQDPFALPVTVTGQSAEYQSLSRMAKVLGDVQLWRGDLYARSQRADLDGMAGTLTLGGGVDMRLGTANHIRSRSATLGQGSRSLEFEGGVEASIIPAALRRAAAHPEK